MVRGRRKVHQLLKIFLQLLISLAFLLSVPSGAGNYSPAGSLFFPSLFSFHTGAAWASSGPRLVIQQGLVSGLRVGGEKGRARAGMAVTTDGTVLAVADGKSVVLLDARTGAEVQRFAAHSGPIADVAFTIDGSRLLSVGAYDLDRFGAPLESVERGSTAADLGTVKLWDPASGQEVGSFSGLAGFASFGAFCNGSSEIIATDALEAIIWKVSDRSIISRIELEKANRTVLADVDEECRVGLTFVTGAKSFSLVDLRTGRTLRTIETSRPVTAGTFAARRSIAAIGQEDGAVSLYELSGYTVKGEIATAGNYIHLLEKSAGSPFIIAIDSKGEEVTSINVEKLSLKRFREKTADPPETYASAAISADGQVLFTNSASVRPKLSKWDLRSEVKQYDSTGVDSDLQSMLLGVEKERFCTAGVTVSCWDLLIGQVNGKSSAPASLWLYQPMLQYGPQVVDAPDSPSFYGISGSTIQRIDYVTREILATFSSSAPLTTVGISRQGRRLAASDADGEVTIWDTAARSVVSSFRPTRRPLQALVFSPDEQLLACGEGMPHFLAPGEEPGRDVLTLWKVESGALLHRLPGAATVQGLSFNDEGTIIAAGTWDEVAAWNTGSGSLRYRKWEHRGLVLATAFLPGRNLLLSTGADHRTVVWDGSTGQVLANLLSRSDGGWVVTDPAGHFDADDLEQVVGLHWVMPDDPMTALPVEIFMRDYYEPRLLPRILSGGKFGQIRPLTDLNRVQPQVRIISVDQAKGNLVQVTVEVQGAQKIFHRNGETRIMSTGVYDLRLFRNGQMVSQWPKPKKESYQTVGFSPKEELDVWRKATEVRLGKDGKFIKTFQVRLPRRADLKEVIFTAYAFNEDRVKSETATWRYLLPDGLQAVKGRAYLVTVGVSANEDLHWRLTAAAEDAKLILKALSQNLSSVANYGIEKVVPVPLITVPVVSDFEDAESRHEQASFISPTKENIRTVIDLLAGREVEAARLASLPPGLVKELRPVQPEDLIVFSFSSHGITDARGEFYLLPYDLGTGSGGRITAEVVAHGIGSQELSYWLSPMDAERIYLIIDACHSAAAVDVEGFKPGPMGNPGLGQLSYDKKMPVLAATQAADSAWAKGYSLLSYAFAKEGIERKMSIEEGDADLLQALKYAETRVPKLYEEMMGKDGKRQLPKLFNFRR